MGTGYTRNDTPNNIADGNVINASDLDGEFDAIQSAFDGTTGHSHDGTTGEGPQIGASGIANDAVALGTKTTGNYVAAGAVSGVGLSGSASAEGATFTVTSNATSANTASTIVSRDASGNFSAGTITASLTGTASNADQLDSLDSTQFLRSDAADTKTSGDLAFADNVKAVFGAGSDLQIYHDGSASRIVDSGTSDLVIQATNLIIQDGGSTEQMAKFTKDAEVNLNYNGFTKFATTSSGISVTGNIVVSGNVDGRDVASDGSKLDGIASSADNYSSWTISDGSNSEAIGSGNTLTIAGGGDTTTSYSAASNTLTVTTNAPEAFTSGTLMLFQQTAAPTGWTKQTTHNNKALRVVSGTASSGGSSAFTTAFGTPSVSGSVSLSGDPSAGNLAVSVSGNISSTTLTTAQIPSHSHVQTKTNTFEGSQSAMSGTNVGANTVSSSQSTGNTGGGGSHNHGHNLSGTMTGAPGIGTLAGSLSSATASINVQYVDLIIASKD